MVAPGEMLFKDPNAVLVYVFDWTAWLNGAQIASSSFTISGDDSALTKDAEQILSGNLKTSLRLSGGTLGERYTVTNRVVTNEATPQTDDRTVTFLIVQK